MVSNLRFYHKLIHSLVFYGFESTTELSNSKILREKNGVLGVYCAECCMLYATDILWNKILLFLKIFFLIKVTSIYSNNYLNLL